MDIVVSRRPVWTRPRYDRVTRAGGRGLIKRPHTVPKLPKRTGVEGNESRQQETRGLDDASHDPWCNTISLPLSSSRSFYDFTALPRMMRRVSIGVTRLPRSSAARRSWLSLSGDRNNDDGTKRHGAVELSFLLPPLSLSLLHIYIFKKYYRSIFGQVVLQSTIQPIISNCSKYRTTYLLSLSFSLFLYLEFVDFIDPLSVGKYFCNTFVLPSDMFQSIGSNLLSKFIHNHSLVRSIFVEILINE